MRVIEGTEAEEMLTWGSWSNHVDGYIPLGQIRQDISVGDETGLSMRELLGKDAPAPVLFEHPRTKELMELVPTDEAEAVLLAKGLLKNEPKQAKMSVQDMDREMRYLKSQFEDEQQRVTNKAVMAACVKAIRDTSDTDYLINSAFLRAWLQFLQLDSVDCDEMAEALGYTFQDGEDEMDALNQHIRSCGHADLCRATVVMALREESRYGDDSNPLMRDCIATNLGVPIKEVTAKAVKEVKAKFTAEIKVLQAKIDAQNPVPSIPAAQPVDGTGSKIPKARAAKSKLTAADAQSGIAAAMQEMEEQPADPLYDQALELVLKEQKASKRLLKEHLHIGQIKALQLLDQMEQDGKVSACDERGARKVLVAA
jgi:hypothetical protein